MKKKHFSFLLVTIASMGLPCLPSCSNVQVGKHAVKEIIVGQNELSSLKIPATSDTLCKEEGNLNMITHISGNNLCKLYYKETTRPLKFEIWNMDGDSKLYSYDAGDDLPLMPFATFSQDYLTLHDILSQKTVVINIAEASENIEYVPVNRPSDINSSRILPWGERLVFLNDYSFVDGIPRVLFSNRKWNYKEKKNYRFNSTNVVHGSLIRKEDMSKIAYVPSNDNTIELLDNQGRKETLLIFYHEKKQGIGSFDNNGITVYAYKFPPVPCFSSACAGKNSFIAGYVDDNGNHSIVILDWDGNLLGGFNVNGEILDLSFSEDENTIYSYEHIGNYEYLIAYNSPLNE